MACRYLSQDVRTLRRAAAAHDRIGGIMTVWPIGSRGSGQPVTLMLEA
jgi:hypothetical protein